MNKSVVRLALVALCIGATGVSAAESFDGQWVITAIVEDGAVVPSDEIKKRFAVDGQVTVDGQSISFVAPSTQQRRTLLFVTDEKATPKTFDLAGTEHVGSKGIYQLMDDVLLLCLAEPNAKERPTQFSAKEGSARVLLTLHRGKATTHQPPPPPVKDPPPAVEIKPMQDDKLRPQLIGSWAHQDDDWVHRVTLNSDQTYSASKTYKHRFGKIFNENVRTSGTWKVQDNVVILTCTASTNKDLLNQISSYRIRSITENEVISVDQFGRMRRDWRTK